MTGGTRGVILLGLLACAGVLGAQEVKLGSLAPTASPFEETLRAMASDWSRLSNGRVVVRVYAGGIVGDEPDMVRKMRIGQLGAAALTLTGLSRIYSGALAIAAPMLIQDDAEMAYVFERMQPFLNQQLKDRGYTVLLWRHAGWIHFFSRQAAPHPDQMRRQRLWVWDAEPTEVRAWQDAGLTVVSLPSTEVMTGLQNGMIDAFATSPLSAASFQWFGLAQHMSTLRWAPLIGAIVINDRVWNRIPAQLRPALIAAAERAGRFMGDPSESDQEAIGVMQRYGLQVDQITSADQAAWQEIVDTQFNRLIGPVIDPEAYSLTRQYVEEYRRSR